MDCFHRARSQKRYVAKRKRKEELLNNMMMLLAPPFLNPCFLPPFARHGDDFFPRLIIIQHIKRRRRVRFRGEWGFGTLGRSAVMHLFELSKRAAFSLFRFHNTCWVGGRERRWGNSRTLQGSAIWRAPGCVNAAGKARQMW